MLVVEDRAELADDVAAGLRDQGRRSASQPRDAGVKFATDTDSHSLVDRSNMRYGVAAARFGGLTSADVINAWPLDRLEEFLRKGRSSLRLLASNMYSR